MKNVKQPISLDCYYANYLAGLLDTKEFETEVFNTAKNEIHKIRTAGWKEEDYDDCMSWLYPRICRMIKTYQDVGASFETYLKCNLRLSIKEYRASNVRNYTAEAIAWKASNPDMSVYESEPEYEENVCEEEAEEVCEKNITDKNSRRLLILTLKCCHYISEDFMEKLSAKLGVEISELRYMIESLRENRLKRMKKIETLREKINFQFYRCMVYEKNLLVLTDEIAVQRVKRINERGRKRLANMREHMGRLRPDPSNSQIANLLGISKGTVDAALHFIKIRWEKSNDILN